MDQYGTIIEAILAKLPKTCWKLKCKHHNRSREITSVHINPDLFGIATHCEVPELLWLLETFAPFQPCLFEVVIQRVHVCDSRDGMNHWIQLLAATRWMQQLQRESVMRFGAILWVWRYKQSTSHNKSFDIKMALWPYDNSWNSVFDKIWQIMKWHIEMTHRLWS